jgi:hypothetical protein
MMIDPTPILNAEAFSAKDREGGVNRRTDKSLAEIADTPPQPVVVYPLDALLHETGARSRPTRET